MCHCVHGYSGDTCDVDTDECSSSPCQNGATCSTPAFDMYKCECLTGYTGTNCETDGGTCSTPQLDMFSCTCAAGYTGTKCETGKCVFFTSE
ncbi:hypothetical protein NP493_1270g00008 [Ridgeia piscesae]|uniref:EGF-like domain-containing protein n=1 Tax=Ridgeia piscesae TaxID=27915 RepID=A0AAD9K9P4_RIDPI|nr:hypothetical protein NP493_1270g00008 [Ridgeia piscesae]